jgi:hypothetical protein
MKTLQKDTILKLIKILTRIRENNESYFKNAIIYGVTTKVPFPNSYFAYNIDTNFFEYILMEDPSCYKPNKFFYLPKNKVGKKYIVLSKPICDIIIDLYNIQSLETKYEKIDIFVANAFPQMIKAIEEEIIFFKDTLSEENNKPQTEKLF